MLHPRAQALLRLIEEKGVPPTYTLPPPQARELYRARRTATQPEPPPVAVARDLAARGPAGDIPLRLYRPQGTGEQQVLPVLVYYHGGGWTIGDLETHDVLCRQLATFASCAVVAVDYRLAPEHPFPAAVEDCTAAARWVRDNAAALAVDANRLAVGGDSAGGNLAAVVALDAREKGDLRLAFQLLIYPATDQLFSFASHQRNGQGYLLTQESVRYYHGHYLPDPRDDHDWRASPLLHPDLSRLPPALVLTAGYDPLVDEGRAYAQKLLAAGTRCAYVCFEHQLHGFITMGRVLDEADTAVRLCAAELRAALA